MDSSLLNYAENSFNFVSHWGVSIPTTCCYQFIIPEKLKEEQLECIQFFLLTGLGICYPIKDYWSHCFTASNFTHCTSTPLFRLGGKVYVKRPKGVHIFAWGKSGPSKPNGRKSSNKRMSARLNRNSIGEFVDDGIGVATNSNDFGEGESTGESRKDFDEEVKDSNAPEDHNGEVDSLNITEKNNDVFDGEVPIGIRDSMGGVEDDGFGDSTISNDYGEVEVREESRDDRDDGIIDANSPDDHNGEVDFGDITEKNNGVSDGEVKVGSGKSTGRVFDHRIGDGAVVEYIHNSNDSGEENEHCDENNNDEENQDDNTSDENNVFEIPLSEIDCYFILGLKCGITLTKEILYRAYRKAMKLAHPDKAKKDEVSQQEAKQRCHNINCAKEMLEEMLEEMYNVSPDEYSEQEYGSGGEYGDGWGPGCGEDDGYDSAESENQVTEEMLSEAFEILGINPKIQLTAEILTKAYRVAIMKAHPDKAKPDEVSQKKAKELSQKINDARDLLKNLVENPDGSFTFPVDVDDNDSDV